MVVITRSRPVNIVSARNYALFNHGREAFGHTRVMTVSDGETLDGTVRQAVAQKCQAIAVSCVSRTAQTGKPHALPAMECNSLSLLVLRDSGLGAEAAQMSSHEDAAVAASSVLHLPLCNAAPLPLSGGLGGVNTNARAPTPPAAERTDQDPRSEAESVLPLRVHPRSLPTPRLRLP